MDVYRLAAGFSILLLMFYAYQTWKSTCGWEEIYVCAIEVGVVTVVGALGLTHGRHCLTFWTRTQMVKVILEFFFEFKNPSMLYLATGAAGRCCNAHVNVQRWSGQGTPYVTGSNDLTLQPLSQQTPPVRACFNL